MCESPPWHWALTTCGLVWLAALPGTLTTRCSLSSVKLWIGEMEQLSWGVLGRGRAHSKLRHHSKEQVVTSLGQIWLGPLSHSISPAILSSPATLSLLLSPWGRGASSSKVQCSPGSRQENTYSSPDIIKVDFLAQSKLYFWQFCATNCTKKVPENYVKGLKICKEKNT